MSENSILLLAVKRATALGSGALKGGNSFQNYYAISSLSSAEVYTQYMPDYIDMMKDDFSNDISPSVRQQALHSLDVAKIFSTYEFDDEQSMFFNTAYNNNNGKMSFYCYSFQPQTSGDTILAESLSLSIR